MFWSVVVDPAVMIFNGDVGFLSARTVLFYPMCTAGNNMEVLPVSYRLTHQYWA